GAGAGRAGLARLAVGVAAALAAVVDAGQSVAVAVVGAVERSREVLEAAEPAPAVERLGQAEAVLTAGEAARAAGAAVDRRGADGDAVDERAEGVGGAGGADGAVAGHGHAG